MTIPILQSKVVFFSLGNGCFLILKNKDALNRIDEMLKSDPPPVVHTKALYRGMAMKSSDYSKFMKSFKEGSTIDLPISSFSFDAKTATEFANNVGNANATIDKANN